MGYCLGIDVGTTSTAAAIVRDGAVQVVALGALSDSVPSILFVTRDFQLVVGEAAARQALTDPSAAARHYKRRLGDPVPLLVRGSPYSAEMLIAKMLSWVVDQVVDREGEEPETIVASHPANWGPYKQELFHQALRLADLGRATTITEPSAAAQFYASQRRVPPGATLAVYDLGGGTFDAAVLRKDDESFEMLGDSTGIEHLGGVDFDEAVLGHAIRALPTPLPPDADEDPAYLRPMYALRRACVEAKELLSSESSAAIPVLLPGVDRTVRLTRAELEDMIRSQIGTTLDVTREAIEQAGVAPSELSAILLVGGSSRIPLVADMLRSRFGLPVTSDIDPIYAVARGAALDAAARAASMATSRPVGPPATPPLAAPPAPVIVVGPPPVSERPTAGLAASLAPATAGGAAGAADAPAAHGPPPAPPVPQGHPPTASRDEEDGLVESVHLHGGNGGGRRRLALVGGAAVVVAALVGGALALRGGGDSDNASSSDSTSVPGAPADPLSFTAAGMVPIAAGTYAIGDEEPILGELRRQEVVLDAYYLDEYEVKVADYRAFWPRAGRPSPRGWNGSDPGQDVTDEHPVEGVSLGWAGAYCQALGKRLPSEVEFEVAARGPEGLKFPWGNASRGEGAVQLPRSGTYAIGAPEFAANVSGFGAHDLYGNAWEWVSPPTDPVRTGYVMLRSPGRDSYGGTNGTRLWLDPETSGLDAGFRCAASPDATVKAAPQFGAFDEPPPEPPPAESVLQPGEIIATNFSDPGHIGFVRGSLPNGYHGWHPEPAELGNAASYHLDARDGDPSPIVALQGVQVPESVNVQVETEVRRFRQLEHEVPAEQDVGGFWYGLVARASADPAEPAKATSYLAFE
ncbi:MAG: Hsp70 family protein, partial [Acidimicrobiia bacterium]|nr:Hsp70 family protein [Acidimicrobiia bacterium]